MKRYFFFTSLFCMAGCMLLAQKNKQQYPNPEYSNEIYLFKKDSATLMRLEKGSSKMETKMKMGGFGGGENGYTLDEGKSPVRLKTGSNLSFIFYAGEVSSNLTPEADSAMKANGMSQTMQMNPMSMLNDPAQTTSLYNMTSSKGKRKIILMSAAGMKLLGKGKKESTKYMLSIKKIKEGYYEMIVDKPLSKGEYAFVVMSYSSMDGSYLLFAFGVD